MKTMLFLVLLYSGSAQAFNLPTIATGANVFYRGTEVYEGSINDRPTKTVHFDEVNADGSYKVYESTWSHSDTFGFGRSDFRGQLSASNRQVYENLLKGTHCADYGGTFVDIQLAGETLHTCKIDSHLSDTQTIAYYYVDGYVMPVKLIDTWNFDLSGRWSPTYLTFEILPQN